MFKRIFLGALAFAFASSLAAPEARAQREIPRETARESTVYHQVEGRVQFRGGRLGGIRVILVKLPDMRKVGETFTRPEGQFIFNSVLEGEYAVETPETDEFAAAAAGVSVRPLQRQRPTTFTVMVDLRAKVSAPGPAPGVVAADVDLDVPKEAQKHYRAGMKAVDKKDGAAAVRELRAAVEAHPNYYAARLELARELRAQKRLEEADEVLRPLPGIAPRRAAPRIERGIVLLGLKRHAEAAEQLEAAVRLEEANWAAHLYLGWALLESDEERAGGHFRRALELDEHRAARAHLSLARLANSRGQRQLAVEHLDAYVALAPDAPDAEAARKLADSLRPRE